MRRALASGLLTSAVLTATVIGAGPAAADPAMEGDASAYAATASVAGTEIIPPTPLAEVTAPPFGDDEQTTLPVDVDPIAVNGTLIGEARVHQAADLTSALEQPASEQDVDGPYNAQAVGQIEDLEVIQDAVGDDVSLVEADAVRGEAVAVCSGDTVAYSASSEVVNLVIGGEDPLSGPLNDLITDISDALNASPLVDLVDIDVNVVTANANGASVDALVISVLPVVDPASPLIQVRLGHAEVSGVACGAAAVPECSDTVDNDDDGVADIDDPGCHTDGDATNPDSYDPDDDDETDDGLPECSDGVDNDGDGVADIADPDCHTDGDATNPNSYDRNDDDESADPSASALPRTGAAVPTAAATGLGLAALGLFALRRRVAA